MLGADRRFAAARQQLSNFSCLAHCGQIIASPWFAGLKTDTPPVYLLARNGWHRRVAAAPASWSEVNV